MRVWLLFKPVKAFLDFWIIDRIGSDRKDLHRLNISQQRQENFFLLKVNKESSTTNSHSFCLPFDFQNSLVIIASVNFRTRGVAGTRPVAIAILCRAVASKLPIRGICPETSGSQEPLKPLPCLYL